MSKKLNEVVSKMAAGWDSVKVPYATRFRVEAMTGADVRKVTDLPIASLEDIKEANVYLVIFHHNTIVDVVTDKIRPDGDQFCRDISMLPDMLERIYLFGFNDGLGKSLSKISDVEVKEVKPAKPRIRS